MRKLAVGTAIVLFTLGGVGTAQAQTADKDCKDFDTLAEAIAWNKAHPEDGPDADNDGRVCEARFPGQKPAQNDEGDKDCADFDTLAEAIAWNKAHPEDRLDADNDGRVCEAQFPGQKPAHKDKEKAEVPTEIPAGV